MPHTGKDRASCQSGGAPALRPGAIAQSPGREAALAWASLAQRFPASSVLAREGAGCGSVGDVPGAWPGIKTIPMEKKCKKAKWLSGAALQIAVKRREVKRKGEKERYKHLNAEFQSRLSAGRRESGSQRPWLGEARPGQSPGEGNGNLFQYSCLENSMDCIVHGVTKSRTQLSDFHPDPSSKATLGGKAQHEGALPPPCIVRKDPRVPHTARRGA